MIIKPAQAVNIFCNVFVQPVKIFQKEIFPRLITAILMANGDPHFAEMARTIAETTRHRSTIMRFFKTKGFKSREDYRRAIREVIKAFKKLFSNKNCFLILDGTSTKRGGFTKILNAIKYKQKDKSKKGTSTKSHMFLMGILITENGMRIPLPRMTYYTREYCKLIGRKHVSIVELAVKMIEQAPIPESTTVTVLADEYFEGQYVHAICQRFGYSYIMPVDKRRCFSDRYDKRIPGQTLFSRGLEIKRSQLEKISFVTGKEDTASFRRIAKSNLNIKRDYYAYSEERNVAGLGTVKVTYSRKKVKKSSLKKESYRVFVTNNLALSTRQVVEYYELRWQIELFFRELKSTIGIDRFRGGDFASFERYIDMVLLSFLFLECYRLDLINQSITFKEKSEIATNRSEGLIRHLKKEINIESAGYMLKLNRKREGKKKLLKILNAVIKAA